MGEAAEARPHELSAALHSRSWYMRITVRAGGLGRALGLEVRGAFRGCMGG